MAEEQETRKDEDTADQVNATPSQETSRLIAAPDHVIVYSNMAVIGTTFFDFQIKVIIYLVDPIDLLISPFVG